ncbi:MAG: hypothetical protein U0935_16775 [Pirellulales bacterium]
MMRFLRKGLRFVRAEEGPTAVEYAVMAALFIVVCLTAISTFQPRPTVAPPATSNPPAATPVNGE